MTLMCRGQTNRLLGYPADARLLIINADDFGMCHAVNAAISRTLQVLECAGCGFHALAVYRESRHGALDSEAWRHEGYRVSGGCQCSTHRRLGQQTGSSREALQQSGVKVSGVFAMGSGTTG